MAQQHTARGRGESSTSERRLTAAERGRQALELRKAGATFDDIAGKLGYADRGCAYRAVRKALKETLREPADEVRKLEAERLDKLQLALWASALRGDTRSIYPLLRVMSRRAKLLGLDAPVGFDGPETGALDALMKEMRSQFGADFEEAGDDDI